MLSNTLNTNEVKDAAGSEVEYTRLSINERSTEFAKVNESDATPEHLKVSHQESGSGLKRRRRSVIRFDDVSISDVDSETPVTDSGYIVLDTAVGAHTTKAAAAKVIAKLLSFCATTGAATTVLFDGTGTGAGILLSGGL